MRLTWPDYVIVVAYLAAMVGFGLAGTRRERSDEEYFLVGRRMPWLAVGISIVSSMLSSITYLAEPGEVWKSGVTHATGKLLGIPFAMLIVWGFCIPFMMRFEFTSAYEYLEHRFGRPTRRFGAALFVTMVVLWMGLAVLVPSQVVEKLSGVPLTVVIFTVGTVVTLYTMLGGLRVVMWTDVVQVAVLVAGAAATVSYIAWNTDGSLVDWIEATKAHLLANGQPSAIPLFSWDPTLRATVVSVAINMAVWQLCMHSSNQITVQRYFSTRNVQAARRSYVASSVIHVGISLLLLSVGLAVLFYYQSTGRPIDGDLDPETQRDLIFPTFALQHLPVGFGGLLLAALWAAAMSIVDSGLNSIATVISLEVRPNRVRGRAGTPPTIAEGRVAEGPADSSHVHLAMFITAVAGMVITVTACGLTWLPPKWGIFGVIPRTFNAVTGPLGALFLVGMFLPRVRQRAAVAATVLGLGVSVVLGYLNQISVVLHGWGWIDRVWPDISFAWILPCSFVATMMMAPLLIPFDSSAPLELAGLTWSTRREWTRYGLPADRT